jgi:hypothetical protein
VAFRFDLILFVPHVIVKAPWIVKAQQVILWRVSIDL